MNPQHPDLESGALSIRATGLLFPSTMIPRKQTLLRFSMRGMGLAKLAIFLQFETILHRSLVLGRRIVALFTFRAG